MLIEFTVGNFRSFRDRQTFSMVATDLKSAPGSEHLDVDNVVEREVGGKPLRLLTSAAVYGANASGKSNLAAALKYMRTLVLNSAGASQAKEEIAVEPFLLREGMEGEPSFFEVVFLHEGQRFRYGFEVTAKEVVREWLFGFKKRETEWFVREEQSIEVNSRNFPEAASRREFVRPTVLFLSLVASLNGNDAGQIVSFFRNLGIISGLNDNEHRNLTRAWLMVPQLRSAVIDFVRQLDVSVTDIHVRLEARYLNWISDPEQINIFDLLPPEERPEVQVNRPARRKVYSDKFETIHNKYNESKEIVGVEAFELEKHESDGTRRLIYLSASLLQALDRGGIMVIDEMDARLHPIMTRSIIRLFSGKETNPHGAQLIFATHDTNLLSSHLLRRDQIWFTEKDDTQASHIYSLAEYRMEGRIVRNDALLESDYIQGKFGAIPYLGDLSGAVGEIVKGGEKQGEAIASE